MIANHTGRRAEDHAPAENYFHKLLGPEPTPEFQDPVELEANWNERWGKADDVSRLRTVLVRKPNLGMKDYKAEHWREDAQALVDPDGWWFYKRKTPPDFATVRDQHDQLVSTLDSHGVRVVEAPEMEPGFTGSIYTRDPLVTVPGGAIIGRLAPRRRRGEEFGVTQTVAAAGMPILGTIAGTGMVEGGSFHMLNRNLAAYGTSIRCNDEGARQLEALLRPLDIELIRVPLPGYTIHTDGQFMILDHNTVMANVHRLPYQFLHELEYRGYEIISPHIDEQGACNSLMIEPGLILVASIFPRTAEMLKARNFKVEQIDYEEIIPNGGSIHCSTNELMREW